MLLKLFNLAPYSVGHNMTLVSMRSGPALDGHVSHYDLEFEAMICDKRTDNKDSRKRSWKRTH